LIWTAFFLFLLFVSNLHFLQCIESLAGRQIRALTQTYLTLNLEALAKDADLENKEQARTRLLNMIEQGSIVAFINEKDGMVSFGESAEKYDDAATLAALDAQVRESIHIGSLLRQLDDQIATSADFIQKSTQQQNEGRGFGGGNDEGMGGFGMGGGQGMGFDAGAFI
jgi:hypothetical protein